MRSLSDLEVGGLTTTSPFQKNPFSVRKIRVRNSGAGNGCAIFMDAWKKCVLSPGKTRVHKIPPFRGGVGGGECRFYFYGRADFSDLCHVAKSTNWRRKNLGHSG